MIAARKLQATPGLVKATRGTDITIDNQTVATFTYTIDLPLLFNSPDLPPLIKVAMASSRNSTNVPPMTDAQIKQITTVLAATFQNVTFTITDLVGTTDKLPYGLGIDLAGTLNPAAMGMLAGGGSPSGSNATPLTLNEHFLVKLSAIGKAANVTAPANATPINMGGVLRGDIGPVPAGTEAALPAADQATPAATMEATSAQ